MKVAVVGAGLGGIVAAYTLARAGVEVVVYEKENDLGGHARTFSVDGIDMDLGFMVCNRVTDSSTMRFFEELGVDLELSDMSFSVSLDNGKGYEWSSSNGLPGLFAQKTNVLNPFFWQMLYEIHNFKQHVVDNIYLHRDPEFMPKNSAAWSAWNFLGSQNNHVCVTYWLNTLQNLGNTGLPFLVTLNPPHAPQNNITIWSTSHPVPTPAAAQASKEFDVIQGKRGIWFCGAYQGYGFHEDGLKAGTQVAYDMMGESFNALRDTKQISLTWCEIGARQVVISFLQRYIRTGYLSLFEDGGTVFQFEGNDTRCDKKSILRIHQPSFYWKVATRTDLGLADAYIDGDFTCTDGEEGLLNMLSILIANRDLHRSVAKKHHGREWWSPMLYTAGYWSTTSFLRHLTRRNTLTQARKNISRHYDLSNDLFSLFLDETMTYSCAIFKGPEEPLKDAQLRKYHLLIDKAQIDTSHEVLEIGCGWGSLALEAVKKTGCKYTGITLSEEQLKFAEKKVKEACLEDRITLLLWDYRELPGFHRYDRIISCEMIEHLGDEYIETFFSKCEYLLAENGLLVLQFISIADERYDEYRRSSDFIKEYIFPGGCLPSLSRITSAMAAASRLCVEHVENIGMHYSRTLLEWRKNFHSNRRDILKMGFNEKFIRTWDYYFVYCAAGFKTLTLADYQMVFSRPGNVATFNDPYSPVASVHKLM